MQTCKRGEVLNGHPVDTGSASVGLHPLPCPLQVDSVHDPHHQVLMQGWLRGIPPQRLSPGRVHRRLRVIHGSSLAFAVWPFTVRASRLSRLVWPRLTSIRSRRRLLADALCVYAACCRVRSRRSAAHQRAQACSTRGLTGYFTTHWTQCQVEQTSPNKDMNFRCTTAAFTLSPTPGGFRHLVLTHPGTEPSMRFLSVGSHVCARASFRQALTDLPLPSASSYIGPHRRYRYSYRGLSPHQFMPISGVHITFEPTPLRGTA